MLDLQPEQPTIKIRMEHLTNPMTLWRLLKWTPPKTDEQLLEYVRLFFNFDIPYVPLCQGHQTPFHMLKAIWFEECDSLVCIGCRDGFKTLTLGISEVMELVHKSVGIVHVGAIEEQAKKCYSYVRDYLSRLFNDAVASSIMSKTYMKDRPAMTGGSLQIIPCTMSRVNSPHEPKLRADEIELADPMAYADMKGIPASDTKGNKPSVVYTTTRKFAFGLAQKEIDNAKKLGLPVIMWCYLDVTERCDDKRSGRKPVSVWINRTTFNWSVDRPKEAIAQAKTDHLMLGKETDTWVNYTVFDKCIDCPILPTCCGRLKKANGCKPINDIIVKFRSTSVDFWKSQMECRKPSKKGLVIHAFDRDVHTAVFEIPSNWKIIGWRMVGGKDFNYTPQAALLCFVSPGLLYVYDEISMDQATVEQCADAMKRNWVQRFGRFEMVLCDKTRPDSIDSMRARGIEEAIACDTDEVEDGVDLLNTLFNPVTIVTGGRVRPMIMIHAKNCPKLIWELEEGYRRVLDSEGNPAGIRHINNHYVDCLRYVAWHTMRHWATAIDVSAGGSVYSGREGDLIHGQ